MTAIGHDSSRVLVPVVVSTHWKLLTQRGPSLPCAQRLASGLARLEARSGTGTNLPKPGEMLCENLGMQTSSPLGDMPV